MDDATKERLTRWLETRDGMPFEVEYESAAAFFVEEMLAREAEHTTPVSPEWLDGAEGKRLGFERNQLDQFAWDCRGVGANVHVILLRDVPPALDSSSMHVVTWDEAGETTGRIVHNGIPTIRLVRLAVELATGRR